MPNVSEKKKKVLYLFKILWEETDSEHALTLPQLLEKLESLGITAERKSIYDDLETLRSMGVQIETKKSRTFQYYIEKRLFSLEELQLLAEAVRSADFLSKEQSGRLVRKLGSLCSTFQAPNLKEPASVSAETGSGERPGVKIVLDFPEELLDQIAEHFDQDVSPERVGKSRLRAALRAEPGPDLFAWLFAQGTSVRLTAPKKLAEQFRERAKTLAKFYKS